MLPPSAKTAANLSGSFAVCDHSRSADIRAVRSCSTLTFGLLLTWLRAESGSVVVSAIAHAAFFAVPTARLLAGQDPVADDLYPPTWMAGGAAAAIVAAALVHLATRREASRDA